MVILLLVLGILAGRGLAGHPVLLINPAAEIHQLAALGAERARGIILPLDRLVAGRTLHLETAAWARLEL